MIIYLQPNVRLTSNQAVFLNIADFHLCTICPRLIKDYETHDTCYLNKLISIQILHKYWVSEFECFIKLGLNIYLNHIWQRLMVFVTYHLIHGVKVTTVIRKRTFKDVFSRIYCQSMITSWEILSKRNSRCCVYVKRSQQNSGAGWFVYYLRFDKQLRMCS